MSWRSATATTGFETTVDYAPGRKAEPVSIPEARAYLEGERLHARANGSLPYAGKTGLLAAAFIEGLMALLASIESAAPGAKVEVCTAGHVDDGNGGYGSITVRIHPAAS